jgi:toxin YoeB
MRTVSFHADAWQDFTEMASREPKLFERLVRLINETARNPFSGIGKPEPLRHQLKGWWSRRINDEHRLVYRVSDEPSSSPVAACTTTKRPVSMFSVYIDKDPMKIAVAKLLLEREGILCFIRNEHLSNLTGGSLGPFAFRLRIFDPELCVMNEDDWPIARQLLSQFKSPATESEWLCPQCQELVPSSFDSCWNCTSTPTAPITHP